MSLNHKKTALAAIFTSSVLFGFSFLFSKMALEVVSPFAMLSMRFLTAFLCMTLLILFRVVRLHLQGRSFLPLLFLGLLQPILYFIFESYGIRLTNSSFSGVIIALCPVSAMLLGNVFLKERPTWKQALFMGLSLLGVILISMGGTGDGAVTVLGFLLLIGAVLAGSGFTLLSRKFSQNFTAFDRTYVMFALATVFFITAAWIENGSNYLPMLVRAWKTPSFALSIAYLSVASSVVAFLLINYALTYLSVTITSSFTNLTTLVAVAAGVLILKEPFSLSQFFATLLIVVGVYGVNVTGAETAPEIKTPAEMMAEQEESDLSK